MGSSACLGLKSIYAIAPAIKNCYRETKYFLDTDTSVSVLLLNFHKGSVVEVWLFDDGEEDIILSPQVTSPLYVWHWTENCFRNRWPHVTDSGASSSICAPVEVLTTLATSIASGTLRGRPLSTARLMLHDLIRINVHRARVLLRRFHAFRYLSRIVPRTSIVMSSAEGLNSVWLRQGLFRSGSCKRGYLVSKTLCIDTPSSTSRDLASTMIERRLSIAISESRLSNCHETVSAQALKWVSDKVDAPSFVNCEPQRIYKFGAFPSVTRKVQSSSYLGCCIVKEPLSHLLMPWN